MFWSILIVTLMLCSSLNAYSVENPIQDGTILDKIASVVESKCLRNGDANAFSELMVAIYGPGGCLQQKITPPSNPDEEVTLICTQARQVVYQCMESVLEKLEPCLDVEEKYLPNFLLYVHNATFDFQCGNGGKRIEVFKFILQSVQCDPPLESTPDLIVETCLPKIQLIEDFVKPNYILTKSNLCSAFESAIDCIMDDVLLPQCHDNLYLKAFLTTSFFEYLRLCNDGDISVNAIN